ncbi:MAG: hypothetical protein II545_07025, partial [Lachnospiraceae bacterium]|nr:hypothetical protein [Lachnospiraceae bacterium]
MRSKYIVLLRTLLKSSSLWNVRKYTTDKKKKGRAIGGFIGLSMLFLMIFAYGFFGCFGFYALGLIDVVPVMCALSISTIAFFFTLIKTNGYLFNFKEYDMLMALPFTPKEIAGCKFGYMYVKTLPWYISVILPMMVAYGVFAKPNILAYPVWIILGLFVPVIPMLVASFLGFLIAKVSSGFQKKNMVQTLLMVIFVLFGFSLRYI